MSSKAIVTSALVVTMTMLIGGCAQSSIETSSDAVVTTHSPSDSSSATPAAAGSADQTATTTPSNPLWERFRHVTWGVGKNTPGMDVGIPNPAGWYEAAMGPQTNEKVLYLTYDDGPLPGPTDQILAELRTHNVKATFFVLGRQVVRHPQYIKKITADGNIIANHTYDHRNLVYSKPTEIREQLTRTASLVGPAMGPCMRPPGGMIDRMAAKEITGLGIVPILWTGHNQDWAPPSQAKMIDMLKQATAPGAIILMHDTSSKSGTVEVTRQMIPWWKEQGYRFDTIPACRPAP